ncbi:MAG: sulfatase-like hydrolase/transferase [Gammaproteobacteria bacterium]
MPYFSIGLTLVSIIFFIKSNFKNKFIKTITLFLIYINLVFLGVFYFFNYLSGDGLNEAVIFHIVHGISGFGVDEYIFPGILLFSFILFITLLIRVMSSKLNYKSKKFDSFNGLILICAILSLVINPLINDLTNVISFKNNYADTDTNKYLNKNDIKLIKNSKNIIFLYLEQFEQTYTDESLFPGLTPNLNRLKNQAVTFTNIISPKATNWTIAGMVASQCGIPLITNIEVANNMGGMDKFLSSARCIGDILADNSYNLHYINGSNLEFAGKGKFYKSHGFKAVEGWEELKSRLINNSYKSPWGLFDDSLYEINIDRLNNLRKDDKPYGLFTLTLDTHHPNGYLSSSCRNKIYKEGTNSILNSIHCADYMAASFIENIINDDSFKDTVLVVLSDHMALKNTATSILDKGERRNLFFIFSDDLSSDKISKPGSMFDVAPTVMSLIGANTNGLGLGRNLFIEDSLMAGDKPMNEIIEEIRPTIASLWSFPQIDDGFKISIKEEKILFGSRYVRLPALLLLDSENKTQEVIFDFHYAKSLESRIMDLKNHQKFIWVDDCFKMRSFIKIDQNETSNFCSLIGIANNSDYLFNENPQILDKELIFNFFNNSKKSFFDN